MKIVNVTHWQTRDLKRIATRVVREEFPRDRFNDRAKSIWVYVKYNSSGSLGTGSSGRARFDSNWCTVMVPSGAVDPIDFAYVLGHELGHCKGLKHGSMPPHQEHRNKYSRDHYGWAQGVVIRRQVVRPRVRPSNDARLTHARLMLSKAQTRAKRASTIVKRWTRRVRDLERRGLKLAAVLPPSREATDGTLPSLG
jgi:hypothetical protein